MAAAPAPLERAYGVTNIKNQIPFVLDIDDGNYDAWRELFLTVYQSFEVSGHLDGTLLPANDADEAWKKRDGLVKLWIYGTLSKDLFKSAFKTRRTSREIWLRLENFFRNNKEARAIQLDHKLRNTEMGDISIHSYCQELKSIADLLSNVDAAVTERTLVTYLLNGLNGKYDNIINVIMHRQPFPSFEEARSMLILDEERLGKGKKPNPSHTDSASSAKVLAATNFSHDQKDNTLTLIDPSDSNWYMDSGATAHLSNTTGNLKSVFKNSIGKTVTVTNGGKIPITKSGSLTFLTKSRPLSLNNVLVTPSIIKNLVSVRRFTKDNSCSIEFDPFGFSVKGSSYEENDSPQ